MNEENKRPEAKDDSQNDGEATPTKTAPADTQPGEGEVQAYGEPTDASGGGK